MIVLSQIIQVSAISFEKLFRAGLRLCKTRKLWFRPGYQWTLEKLNRPDSNFFVQKSIGSFCALSRIFFPARMHAARCSTTLVQPFLPLLSTTVRMFPSQFQGGAFPQRACPGQMRLHGGDLGFRVLEKRGVPPEWTMWSLPQHPRASFAIGFYVVVASSVQMAAKLMVARNLKVTYKIYHMHNLCLRHQGR
jgi:hypothetical protein